MASIYEFEDTSALAKQPRRGWFQLIRDMINTAISLPNRLLLLWWTNVQRATFITTASVLILWTSIFLYIAFYYTYVPTVSYSRPVYLQYSSLCPTGRFQPLETEREFREGIPRNAFNEYDHLTDQQRYQQQQQTQSEYQRRPVKDQYQQQQEYKQRIACHIPYTEIDLLSARQPVILSTGQQYKFRVDLEVPESEVNWDQGVFMVRMRLLDSKRRQITESARPAMLQYKSNLLRIMNTLFWWANYLSGFGTEKQHLKVTMIEDFVDLHTFQHGRLSRARVEIEARNIQISSASLTIEANLMGLRYFMYNWPLTSAFVGITSVASFLAIIVALNTYRVISKRPESSEEEEEEEEELDEDGYEDNKETAIEDPELVDGVYGLGKWTGSPKHSAEKRSSVSSIELLDDNREAQSVQAGGSGGRKMLDDDAELDSVPDSSMSDMDADMEDTDQDRQPKDSALRKRTTSGSVSSSHRAKAD